MDKAAQGAAVRVKELLGLVASERAGANRPPVLARLGKRIATLQRFIEERANSYNPDWTEPRQFRHVRAHGPTMKRTKTKGRHHVVKAAHRLPYGHGRTW
jgi:hypothetical protein